MEVTFLGTGTSHGVPSLDCMIDSYARCSKGVCQAAEHNPRHSRTRASILVQSGGKNLLVDVSMDFRQQALREHIGRIDSVLITHGHSDHIGGVPDIRSYTKDAPLCFYGSGESMQTIRTTFAYVFDPSTFVGGGIPRIETTEVSRAFEVIGLTVMPILVEHGSLAGCLGYRIGELAYIPDMKSITDDRLELLKGVDTLILNCLREYREHASHLILSQSIALARRIAPRKCYFTHMCHDINYESDSAKIDSWMSFAYDGLKISAGASHEHVWRNA